MAITLVGGDRELAKQAPWTRSPPLRGRRRPRSERRGEVDGDRRASPGTLIVVQVARPEEALHGGQLLTPKRLAELRTVRGLKALELARAMSSKTASRGHSSPAAVSRAVCLHRSLA